MEYFKFWVLLVVLITALATAEKKRTYEFGYIIEGQQHRYEKRDENGVITGDFGFVTGDGVYHATQFAADETGKFRITATRTVKIGLPGQPGSIPIPRDLFLQADYYRFKQIKPSDMATCSTCAVPERPKSAPKDAKPIVTMTVKQKEDNVQRVMTLEVLQLPKPIRKDPLPADVQKKEFVPIVHPPNAINPVNLFKPLTKKTGEPSVKVQPSPAPGKSPATKPKALPPPATGTGSVGPQRLGGTPAVTAGRTPPATPQGPRPAIGGTFDARSPVKTTGAPRTTGNRVVATAPKPFKPATATQKGQPPVVTANKQPSFAPKTTTDLKTGFQPRPTVSGGKGQFGTPPKPQTSGGISKSGQTTSSPKKLGIDPRFDAGDVSDSNIQRPQPVSGDRQGSRVSGGVTPSSGAAKPQQAGSRGSVKHGTSTLGGILYRFNYTAGYHGHHEQGDRAGSKDGGYQFVGRDGLLRRIDYIANEFGYQPHLSLETVGPEETPREETEKEAPLKGYEFKWFNPE